MCVFKHFNKISGVERFYQQTKCELSAKGGIIALCLQHYRLLNDPKLAQMTQALKEKRLLRTHQRVKGERAALVGVPALKKKVEAGDDARGGLAAPHVDDDESDRQRHQTPLRSDFSQVCWCARF